MNVCETNNASLLTDINDISENWFTILVICYIVTGGLLNVLLIGSVLKKRSLRTSPTYIVLVNLAVSDFLLLVAGGSIHLHFFSTQELSDIYCAASSFVWIAIFSVSAYTMLCFSALRYVIVVHPFWARRQVTASRVTTACILIWIVAVSKNAIAFDAVIVGVLDTDPCPIDFCVSQPSYHSYGLLVFITDLTLPLLLITGFHTAKIIQIRRNTRDKNCRAHGDQKTVSPNIVLLVIISFLVCYIPYMIIVNTIYVFHIRLSTEVVKNIMLASNIVYLNSVLNPIFYFFISKCSKVKCSGKNLTRQSFQCVRLGPAVRINNAMEIF